MGNITQLLEHARQGDTDAWNQVVTLLHEDLLRMAKRTGAGGNAQTLNATALVNECYLRFAQRQADGIHDRAHFLAVASCAMRQILINYARDHLTAKRGAGAQRITLNDNHLGITQEADDLLALDTAMRQLAQDDPRLVRIVECRVFGGMNEQEAADALQLPLRTTQRLWHDARARLRELMAG